MKRVTAPGDTDAILTFGYLADIWEWQRYHEILSAIREMHEFPVLSDEASIYLNNPPIEASGKEVYGFSSLPNEEAIYVRDVQMSIVPSEALQRFKQQMQEVQPFELDTPAWATFGRDGMLARGIIVDQDHAHRFDICTAEHELTDRQ